MIRRSNEWFEHALKRSAWQPQRQGGALATLGFFISLILGALYLSQVAAEATTNRRLEELLDQRDDLERINEQLNAEIAALKSIGGLQVRAESMGFTLASQDQILYLPVEGYQPVQPDTVAPMDMPELTETDVADVYNETFTDWLERQWESFIGAFGG